MSNIFGLDIGGSGIKGAPVGPCNVICSDVTVTLSSAAA